MTPSISKCKNDSEDKITPQPNFLCDSPVNDALIAIAQEVAELLKQSYLVQANESDDIELVDENSSTE